jgi:hypothetical protein
LWWGPGWFPICFEELKEIMWPTWWDDWRSGLKRNAAEGEGAMGEQQ